MSLLTDNDVVSVDDLAQIDSEIKDVAEAQEINLEGRPGIIRQAWSEAKTKLLQSQQQYAVAFWGGNAVLNTGGFLGNQTRNGPSQIVTSSPYSADVSALHNWMAHLALWKLFSAASRRNLNDRFALKADHYQTEEKRLWEIFASKGIPLVYVPLECPGALHSVAGGIWSDSNVSAVSGGSGLALSYDVAITYVDQSRYVSASARNNGESGPSAMLTTHLDNAQFLRVSIASLNPPNGLAQRTADGTYGSLTATGWNIYAGVSGSPLTLQNVAPIPITTTSYTFTADPGNTGPALSTGQTADLEMPFTKLFFRG